MPKVTQIEIGGSSFTYTERGMGEPVVLVHGALGDYRTWAAQLETLSQRYRVISYSRRFHYPNSSIGVASGYSHRQHVNDLIALIETLGLGPTHLLGHSYGGSIALLVAIERPELIRRLVLVGTLLFSILTRLQDRVSVELHRISLGAVQKLAEVEEPGLALAEYLRVVIGKNHIEDLPSDARLELGQNTHTLAAMLRSLAGTREFDQTRSMSVKTPTLVVTGESSLRLYQRISSELHGSLLDSEFLVVPGVTEGLKIDDSTEMRDAVFDFLSVRPVRFQTAEFGEQQISGE